MSGAGSDPQRAPGDGVEARAAIYKIAFDEAVRRLNHQDAQADLARQRTLQLVTVLVAASAFLGGTAIASADRTQPFYALASSATALFVFALVCAVLVLRPINGWLIETLPRVIVQDYAEASRPASLAETYRNLAIHYENFADSNEEKLTRVQRFVEWALVASGLEVALLLVLTWTVA